VPCSTSSTSCSAPDHATDQAARAYLATYLTGRNVLLMAADWCCPALKTTTKAGVHDADVVT
jgi:hypothetical protein